jgi:hypothetical protein
MLAQALNLNLITQTLQTGIYQYLSIMSISALRLL